MYIDDAPPRGFGGVYRSWFEPLKSPASRRSWLSLSCSASLAFPPGESRCRDGSSTNTLGMCGTLDDVGTTVLGDSCVPVPKYPSVGESSCGSSLSPAS